MSDGKYQPLVDSSDDLPRTLRRAREQQVREQQTREAQTREMQSREGGGRTAWDRGPTPGAQGTGYGVPSPASPYDTAYPAGVGEGVAAGTVTRFKVPFVALMGFFIKAVFAAVPAILILVLMLYGLGIALQTYFPQLIKMKILISFP